MLIHTLDLFLHNTPQATASFLVISPDGPILVETGPGSTIPSLLKQLNLHGITPKDIKHVIVTHIHLDHAGATGWWAQNGAHVYVHHRGARHLIDPSILLSSASRIYGDKMDSMWGSILPVPENNITEIFDEDIIEIGGLSFEAIETPGHARHHHAFQIGDIAFLGDAGGVRLPQNPVVSLPAPPPEFDIDAWQTSIDRLLERNLKVVYLTHFGRIDNVRTHLEEFKALLNKSVEFIIERIQSGFGRDDIVKQYRDWNYQRALKEGSSEEMIRRYKTANPLYMSVDGIMRYCRKKGLT